MLWAGTVWYQPGRRFYNIAMAKTSKANSLEFFLQRGNPGALNRIVFEADAVFTAFNQSVPMTIANTDLPFGPNKHMIMQIKDIIVSLYLPICLLKSNGTVFEDFSDVKAIYERLTFILTINGKNFEYPVVFTKNGDTVISSNYLAQITEPIVEMSCRVISGFFSDTFLTYPHRVALIVESFLFPA